MFVPQIRSQEDVLRDNSQRSVRLLTLEGKTDFGELSLTTKFSENRFNGENFSLKAICGL